MSGTVKPSRVTVIGYRAWQERYHGDPHVLGKNIRINGEAYTVIGVHPVSFPGLTREISADVTVPLIASMASAEWLYDRTRANYTVIGRLRDGVDATQARADRIGLAVGPVRHRAGRRSRA